MAKSAILPCLPADENRGPRERVARTSAFEVRGFSSAMHALSLAVVPPVGPMTYVEFAPNLMKAADLKNLGPRRGTLRVTVYWRALQLTNSS